MLNLTGDPKGQLRKISTVYLSSPHLYVIAVAKPKWLSNGMKTCFETKKPLIILFVGCMSSIEMLMNPFVEIHL